VIARAWGAAARVAALAAALASAPAGAAELIVGEVRGDGDTRLVFRVTGESRDEVVGGTMMLGDSTFIIQRVSGRGLIGGARTIDKDDGFAEFAMFSSSFSKQTAVGVPWTAADAYHHCEQPYNSFLAVYRVDGQAAVQKLGPVPYPDLARDLTLSDTATVYCFMSSRGSGR